MTREMIIILAALGLALLLILLGCNLRRRRGLGAGRTLSLDRITLTSRRHGLTGRPDRLIRSGDSIIVEEWKSSRSLKPWHISQIGVYFLLIEDQMKIKPARGFIVCGNGKRYRIDNSETLRAQVLELARRIRQARAAIAQPIPVNPSPGQCCPCGMRGHCGQARL